jgi:hypothetical protein
MRTPSQIDAIVQQVRSKLIASKQTTGLDLQVPADGFFEDGNWLNILVTPMDPTVRAHQYVAALSDVDKELRASGIQEVLLVPAIAD